MRSCALARLARMQTRSALRRSAAMQACRPRYEHALNNMAPSRRRPEGLDPSRTRPYHRELQRTVTRRTTRNSHARTTSGRGRARKCACCRRHFRSAFRSRRTRPSPRTAEMCQQRTMRSNNSPSAQVAGHHQQSGATFAAHTSEFRRTCQSAQSAKAPINLNTPASL